MARNLKIGFIQAKNEIDVNWFTPLAFGYLKSYLDKYLDFPVEMRFLEQIKDIEYYNIIAISSTSQDFSIAQKIAYTVKICSKDIITILGGHHITCFPQTLPKNIDIGVCGEGEQTFLELMQFFSDNTLDVGADLKKISGLVFRGDDGLVMTPARELIQPLDKIPFPHREAAEKFYLFSSRGCPYKCSFCSSSAFWKKARFFSAEYVVAEIENLLSRFPHANHIAIWDDLFIANMPRLKTIVALIVQRGINKKVSFDLAVRANLVSYELCGLLKDMNVTAVGFGAESASDRILKLLNKGVTAEVNQRAIDILSNYGFLVGCSLIVGSPTETEDEVCSTYEFVLKNIKDGKISPHNAINILTPMPGTVLWDKAVADGIIDVQNMDWGRLAVWASYRNSNINSNIDEWIEQRQKSNPLYLAQSTLPQQRLYELMAHYEKEIKKLEKQKSPLNDKGMFAKGLLFQKILFGKIFKAAYLFVFDFKTFKDKLKKHFSILEHTDANNGSSDSEQNSGQSPFPFPESALAHRYCTGKGLEIGGSAHNPFGLDTLNVDVTDSMDTEFKKREVRLCGKALKVDIVSPGDNIPLPDESQDFIVSSHVIEHFNNPISVLIEWDRLLRPGGIIFIIVPHKERTFERDRDCTTLQHLIDDYKSNNTEPHKDSQHGHNHCWTTEAFVPLIEYMIREMAMQWKIEETQDVDDKVGNGFTIVIRKTRSSERMVQSERPVL